MQKKKFVKAPTDEYNNIYAGDERLQIFDYIFELERNSLRREEIDLSWPLCFKNFYEKYLRITYHQYNILVSWYEKELKKEETMIYEINDKVMKVKFG